MTRLVGAELLKLRTTRLLLWLGLMTFALIALIVSLNAANRSVADLSQANSQRDLVTTAAIAALISLILGIVVPTAEYAHNTIGQTFLVAPLRERVVAAKLMAAMLAGAVLAAFAWAVKVAAPGGSFAVGSLIAIVVRGVMTVVEILYVAAVTALGRREGWSIHTGVLHPSPEEEAAEGAGEPGRESLSPGQVPRY